jgi:hypothetical protein
MRPQVELDVGGKAKATCRIGSPSEISRISRSCLKRRRTRKTLRHRARVGRGRGKASRAQQAGREKRALRVIPLAPVRGVHVDRLLRLGLDPTVNNTTTGKYDRVRPPTIDHGQFQIAVERCGRYALPLHLKMVRQHLYLGVDLHQFLAFRSQLCTP